MIIRIPKTNHAIRGSPLTGFHLVVHVANVWANRIKLCPRIPLLEDLEAL